MGLMSGVENLGECRSNITGGVLLEIGLKGISRVGGFTREEVVEILVSCLQMKAKGQISTLPGILELV